MIDTESQIEWAERIKMNVQAEFERVANALRGQAAKQREQDRTDTDTILAILEARRVEILGNKDLGYFIRSWQEISDQVRQLITRDPGFIAIQSSRSTRASREHSEINSTTPEAPRAV